MQDYTIGWYKHWMVPSYSKGYTHRLPRFIFNKVIRWQNRIACTIWNHPWATEEQKIVPGSEQLFVAVPVCAFCNTELVTVMESRNA